MARKRHTDEKVVTKLRQIDVLMAQACPVAEAIRSIGVTEVTYYRWWNEYGGLKSDQMKRLKELEVENALLRGLSSAVRVSGGHNGNIAATLVFGFFETTALCGSH